MVTLGHLHTGKSCSAFFFITLLVALLMKKNVKDKGKNLNAMLVFIIFI